MNTKGMTLDQLREELEKRGLHADGNVSRDGLITQLNRLEDDNRRNSHSVSQKALEVYNKIWAWNKKLNPKLKEEPTLTITFEHRHGDQELQFNYAGPVGKFMSGMIYKMPTSDGRSGPKRWLFKSPRWHFLNGQQYEVPLSVYNHLNSLIVQEDHVIGQTEAGTPITQRVASKRVSAEHVPDQSYLQNLSNTKEKVGVNSA